MKFIIKFFKVIGISLLVIVFLVNAVILISGRTYLYKGIANTYLKGKTGPTILDNSIFENNTIAIGEPEPWVKHPYFNTLSIPNSKIDSITLFDPAAFVIIKDGQLLHEEYFGDFNEETITNSFSASKSIVSALIGICIKKGLIGSVDDKVSTYLKGYDVDRKDELTIKNLLTMSSGMDWIESGANPFSHSAESYYTTDLQKSIDGLKVIDTPGTFFNYQSGNTQILAQIVSAVTEMDISRFTQQELWQCIGAEHNALWNLDRKGGIEKASCCFYSTATDFAKIGQLYLQNGVWNGDTLLPSWYVKASTQADPTITVDGNKNTIYGYQWWTTQCQGKEVFYMRGILGQYVFVVPSENLVVVRTGNKRSKKKINRTPTDVFLYLNTALQMNSKL